jgi:hypothetical protein
MTTQSAPPLNELVDAVTAEQERRRQQAHLDQFAGGPCWVCGTTVSIVREVDEAHPYAVAQEVAGWRSVTSRNGHPQCYACADWQGHLSESEFRGAVAWEATYGDLTRHGGRLRRSLHLDVDLAEEVGFKFWFESGAEPSVVPFAYLGVEDAAAPIAAPEPPGPLSGLEAGPACPLCGCNARWRTPHEGYLLRPEFNEHGGVTVAVRNRQIVCQGCARLRRSEEQFLPGVYPTFLARLLGLNLLQPMMVSAEADDVPTASNLAEVGAVPFETWQLAHPDHAEGHAVPFTHLDLPAVRAEAFRRWPDPAYWRHPARFEEAKQLAQQGAA